jgi:hypothetical protein
MANNSLRVKTGTVCKVDRFSITLLLTDIRSMTTELHDKKSNSTNVWPHSSVNNGFQSSDPQNGPHKPAIEKVLIRMNHAHFIRHLVLPHKPNTIQQTLGNMHNGFLLAHAPGEGVKLVQ